MRPDEGDQRVTACPTCSAEVAPGARFCSSCGAAIAPSFCAECAAPLTPGARFCGECGSPVKAGGAADGAHAQQVAPAAPVAERRVTSVLFGDLVGFTPLSESRDAEEVRELLSRYFDECRTVIGRYGGTVEKFIGDAVMAVWGVPVAHEDDAERAVRAGLELVATVSAMGEDVGAAGLAMRVGIVTGEVAVTVGATAEGMVAGDAVNTAARVQAAAAPGQVWVDETTRSLSAAAIAFEDVGVHTLKGKAEPLALWCAAEVVADLGGGQRIDGLEAPFTGRATELRLVKELFHATAESGRPRLVVVDGEPGMGKSRLGWEFEKYIDGLTADTRWHRGRCLSYGDGVAFWALAEAVRTRLGLTEADAGAAISERLEAGLVEYVAEPEERDWLRPRLAVLLGAGPSSSLAREDLFAAWTTFLERVGAGDPVVFVIDDAQHADDGLLDFLDHLLDTARAGIFVVALARPELLAGRPALGGRRATVVHLDALDDPAMSTLIDGLVSGLPEPVRSALVARAEGVPLFAVETVRALIDRDAVVPVEGRYVAAEGIDSALDAIGAPASLHALVAARLDALTATERIVVADASVLGLVFTLDGLAALTPDGIDVLDVLAALRRKEIISIETDRFAADRGNYRFVQSVVRQVAYSTQSRRDRKARHVAAADHLSALPDVGDDHATVIAQHLLDALDASSTTDPDIPDLAARASALLERAAHRTRSLGSPSEALRLTTTALAHNENLTDLARLNQLAAECALDAGQYDQAIVHAAHATAGYDELDDPVRAGVAAGVHALSMMRLRDSAGALAIGQPRWDALSELPDSESALLSLARPLAAAYASRGDADRSEFFNKRRLFLAEAVNSPADLSAALGNLGTAYGVAGAPQAALVLLRGAAVIDREHSRPTDLAFTLSNLTSMLFSRDLRQALDTGRESLEVARRSGVRMTIDFAGVNYSLALWTAGELREVATVLVQTAEGVTDPSIEVSIRVMWRWLNAAMGDLGSLHSNFDGDLPAFEDESDLAWLGSLAFAGGTVEDPPDLASSAEQLLQHILGAGGLGDDFVHLWPPLVSAALAAGDTDLAERLIEPVTATRPGVVATPVRAHHHRFKALIGAARGADPNEIESDFQAGINGMLEFGAVGLAARIEEEYGRWLLTQHRATEAALALDHVRAVYTEIGADGWLRDLEAIQPSAVSGSVPSS